MPMRDQQESAGKMAAPLSCGHTCSTAELVGTVADEESPQATGEAPSAPSRLTAMPTGVRQVAAKPVALMQDQLQRPQSYGAGYFASAASARPCIWATAGSASPGIPPFIIFVCRSEVM